MFPFLPLFIVFAFVIFIATIFYLDELFVYMASSMIIIIGVYMTIYGLLELNNWLTKSLSIMLIGIGLYTLIITALHSISN